MGIETKLISTLTSAKTGTVVKKMLTDKSQLQKVIQYGEKTPLRQIGIDTVKITTDKQGGKMVELYNGNKPLFLMGENKNTNFRYRSYAEGVQPLVEHCNNLRDNLKNIFDALRASKAMMG